MKRKLALLISVVAVLFPFAVHQNAQASQPDEHNKVLDQSFLNNLVGDWKLTRKMHGKLSESVVHGEWVLNHQFVFMHMKDTANPAEYEARIYIGYDSTSERYVAHWIDIFGGRISETLGYGNLDGASLKFTFEYPDGPFHNTMTWHPDTRSWTFLMEQKSPEDQWVNFAEDNLRKA